VGFYIDEKEIKGEIDKYKSNAKTVEEQLNKSKQAMNTIIDNTALKGKTGDAIVNNINNNHNAILVGLRDAYKLLATDMENNLSEFQSALGESEENAILIEDAFGEIKRWISKSQSDNADFENAFRRIYSGIDEVMDLSMPRAKVNDEFQNVSNFLGKVAGKVHDFSGKTTKSDVDKQIKKIKNQIKTLSDMGSLPYNSAKFMTFASDTGFANSMLYEHKKVKKDENEKKKEKLNQLTKDLVMKYLDGYSKAAFKNKLKNLTPEQLEKIGKCLIFKACPNKLYMKIGKKVNYTELLMNLKYSKVYSGLKFIGEKSIKYAKPLTAITTYLEDRKQHKSPGKSLTHAAWDVAGVVAGDAAAGMAAGTALGPAGMIIGVGVSVGWSLAYRYVPGVKTVSDKVGGFLDKDAKLSQKYLKNVGAMGLR
jgi:hypothetical protein